MRLSGRSVSLRPFLCIQASRLLGAERLNTLFAVSKTLRLDKSVYTSLTGAINLSEDYKKITPALDIDKFCVMMEFLPTGMGSIQQRKYGLSDPILYANLSKIIDNKQKGLTCKLEKEEETVTIYRAPQNVQKANKEFTQGYDPVDFPRGTYPYPDGAVYFAPTDCRKVAEHWNSIYQSGIIEITMPKVDYETLFKPVRKIGAFSFGESRYFGGDPMELGPNPKEVKIPREDFPKLNSYPRILKTN